MNVREALGLLVTLLGLILLPVGWAFDREVWLASFFFFVVGLILFYTSRMIKREQSLAKESAGTGTHGRPMPTDAHDYTGWSQGGRSKTMDDTLGIFSDDIE